MYDYLIVGAGLFGVTFARIVTDAGKKCLVVDKRNHIAGNCYTESIEGIQVHRYGPHIFHCSDESVWKFVNKFSSFNGFVNSPIAMYKGKAYSLPFSMYTFNQMWGVVDPDEAMNIIQSQCLKLDRQPMNLEEQALMLVGKDLYETLVRGYTLKQWKKDPKELPASIITRLPVRFTWNNNYYNDVYQGVPVGGYTKMFENMLEGIDVKLGVDYLEDRAELDVLASKTVFTGRIDELYGYQFGELEYRALAFDNELHAKANYQGNAVINYTEESVPWTRIIEHKFFEPEKKTDCTYITKEIPEIWHRDKTPYYPVRDAQNIKIWEEYNAIAQNENQMLFGGRLAEYRYYDMHQVIHAAIELSKKEML